MNNFREKYLYSVSLWASIVISLVSFIFTIYMYVGAVDDSLYVAMLYYGNYFFPSMLIPAVLRLISKPIRREWRDILYVFIVYVVMLFSSDGLFSPDVNILSTIILIAIFITPIIVFIAAVSQEFRDEKLKKQVS